MLIAPEFLTTFTTKKMLGTKENNALLKALAGSETEWDLQQTILADMGGIVIDFSNIEDQSINNEKYGLEKTRETRPTDEISRPIQQAISQSGDTIISAQAQRYAQEDNQVAREAPMPSQQDIRSSGDIESEPLCPGCDFITQFERRQSRWFGGCEIPWKRHEPHVRVAIKVKETLKDQPYWKIQTIAALSGSLWTLDSMQLAAALEHGIITKLPDIKTAEINDKNKSDALVKVLAVIQVIWMVVQLCARVYYRYPFAQLELGTVAFSVIAIILYIVEWDKPKDINTPVYVKAAASSVSEEVFEAIANAAPFPYMQFPLVQYRHYYMPSVAFHETAGDLKVINTKSLVIIMTTVMSFGEIHLLA